MNKMRKTLIKVPMLFLLLFILTSCGFWMLPLRKEKSATFSIRSADFSEAFDACVKAARDIRFDVHVINKPAGSFKAEKGYGVDEISILWFQLRRGYRRRPEFTVTVKSSWGAKSVIENFVNSIEKYIDVLPIESPAE